MQEPQHRLMPVPLRWSIYLTFGGVWITGCAWLVLHAFFQSPDEFGAGRHPWEPSLLWLHGVLSIALAYLFGWIMAQHASEAWRQQKRRLSGGLFTAVIIILSVSGFALFFVTSELWQQQSSRLHEIVGVGVTLLAMEHWRVLSRRDHDRER